MSQDAAAEATPTPFCRVQHGNCYRVATNIREVLAELLAELGDWPNLRSALISIQQARRAEAIYGKPIRDTWKLAFLELTDHLSRNVDATQFVPLLQASISTILQHDLFSDCWDSVKEVLASRADVVSGWEVDVEKSLHHGGLLKDSDGGHSLMVDGMRFVVDGVGPESEERLAFIADNTLRKYGEINAIIMFLALIAINDEFNKNPLDFESTVKCELPEGDLETWFLSWIWRVNNIGEPILTYWRPRSCYCDPQWLATDLVARIARNTPVVPRRSVAINDQLRFLSAFKDFPYQLDIGVKTVLLLGDKAEEYFTVDGLPIRWINGTHFEYPVMTVGCRERNCADATRVARRFMDMLAVEARVPVNEGIRAGNHRRYLPYYVEPKSSGGLRLPAESITGKVESMEVQTEKELAAMSFFRQGTNAQSAHDSFLGYYKVVELIAPDKVGKQKEWINENIDSVLSFADPNWRWDVMTPSKKPGNYIIDICRPKTAHAQPDHGAVMQVYSIEEQNNMERNVRVIRALAAKVINERLLK